MRVTCRRSLRILAAVLALMASATLAAASLATRSSPGNLIGAKCGT